jgi:Cation transport ATPase
MNFIRSSLFYIDMTPANNRLNIQLTREAPLPESSIGQVKGVASAQYDKKRNTVSLAIEEKQNDDAAGILQEVVSTIRKAGGEVHTEKISRPVLNMTCASCASSTQNILSFVPGVLSASVNYGNGKGNIEYLPEIVSPSDMKAALQEIGYDLLIEEEEASFENLEHIQEENYQKLRRQTIWAVVLAIPLVIVGMFLCMRLLPIPSCGRWPPPFCLSWGGGSS